MRRDRKHGSHDAADDCVWRLSAADRHVTDGHQLVSTANDQTGGKIAQDRTDDSTGNDRLVQGFQEIKLVDGDDEHPHKDQNDLKCTKAHNKYSFSSIFESTRKAYLNSFSMFSACSVGTRRISSSTPSSCSRLKAATSESSTATEPAT